MCAHSRIPMPGEAPCRSVRPSGLAGLPHLTIALAHVREVAAQGMKREEIASRVGIGVASVHAFLARAKEA